MPDSKSCLLCDSISIKFKGWQNCGLEIRVMVTFGEERKGTREVSGVWGIFSFLNWEMIMWVFNL